jgi:hypothetical protein
MADYQLLNCFQPELIKLERVKYFTRQLLTADDMVTDQDYFRQKLRRHNRFLHGWGVVCGLEVTAAPTTDLPWRVKIDNGYALGPYGDEIYVAEPIYLDLASCGPGAATDPCEPDRLHPAISATGWPLYVAIKYAECVARPVRAMSASCACKAVACEYSRIRDSFQIECLTELPPSHQPDPSRPGLCELINNRLILPCPPCPTEPWVVLAQVTQPVPPTAELAIDNFTFRRQIYSTAVLQEQLIECCCVPPQPEQPEPRPPARVTSIVPEDGSEFGADRFPDGIIEGEWPRSIEIYFDKDLNGDTVSTDTIQVAMHWPNGELDVDGTVSYNETERSAIFTPNEVFPTIVESAGLGEAVFTVTVRGDEPDPIRDVDDLALDGDRHGSPGYGSPGGNFTSQFIVKAGIY